LRVKAFAVLGATALLGSSPTPRSLAAQAQSGDPSTARAALVAAPRLVLPGTVDSNSPAVWDLEDGESRLFVMTSSAGVPRLAVGPGLGRLGPADDVTFTSSPGHGLWMEAIVADDAGRWYGYYHNEIPAISCGRPDRSVARIGAARSLDRGRTWENLGIILEAPPDTVACASTNRYVIGGVGDLSVMLDANKTDLYFFLSQYGMAPEVQGVAVARLLWANRDRPVGRVAIWNEGVWEHGRWNRAPVTTPDGMLRRAWFEYPEGTPLVPTTQPWHNGDDRVNAFWGPSIHWNEFLELYVMLLNRSQDESYTTEGIYVSFAPRLDDPGLWTPPRKLLNGGRWYPQVMGTTPGSGSDKIAGSTARFFTSGQSDYLISFAR
jgi:hypothetical protein